MSIDNIDFNNIDLTNFDIKTLKNSTFVNTTLEDVESDIYDKLITVIKFNFPLGYQLYIKYYLYCYIFNLINHNNDNDLQVNIDDIKNIYKQVNNKEIDNNQLNDLTHLVTLFNLYLINILHIIYSIDADINNRVIRISKLFNTYKLFDKIDENSQYYCLLMHLQGLNGEKCLVSRNYTGLGKNNDNIKSLINSTVNQLNSNYNSNILQMYVSHILPTITFDKNINETNITEIKKQLNKFIKNNNNNIDNKVNDYILQVKNNLSKLNLKAQQYSFNESDSDY
jgi:hypothetical protein